MKIRDARFLASARTAESLPPPAFAEIAFAGRSNVGKSSLINDLVSRKKLVRAGATPGVTRGINLFRIELAEPEAVIDFADLPGYGFARRSKQERRSWGPLIERFLQTRAGLAAVVILVDARRGFEVDDLELVLFIEQIGLAPLCVATKLDKIPASRRRSHVDAMSKELGRRLTGYSAETSLGRDDLWSALLPAAHVDPSPR
jgi:GTP-binding protein